MANKPELLSIKTLSEFDRAAAMSLAGELIAEHNHGGIEGFNAKKAELEKKHELHAQMGGATSIFPHAILLAKSILKLESPKF